MAKKPQIVQMSRFKNRCFIGLNKVTFYTESGDVLTGDNWLELTDEQSRKNMMLAYFAPRDLNGEPMDPSSVLFDEGDEDTDAEMLHQMRNISMFDFCRAEHAAPNEVHIVLVADAIFHWDSQDNYIQPTSDETWVDDLQAVLKGYPRTTKKHIYTDWEIPPKTDLAEGKTYPLEEMPLDHSMWLNQPTFQEQYGNLLLVTGIIFAVLAYAGLSYQTGNIEDMNSKTQALNAQSNQFPNYNNLSQKVDAIEAYNKYRGLFALSFKDISLSIADVNLPLVTYELANPNPREAPEALITSLEIMKEPYPTFTEQEVLAQNIIRSSLSVTKIRKPQARPDAETFSLQGLIPLKQLANSYFEEQKSRQSGRRTSMTNEDKK